MTLIRLPVLCVLTLMPLALSCGSGSDVSDGTSSEVAVSAMSGSSSASEGTLALQQTSRNRPTYLARLEAALNPVNSSLIQSAWAVPSCNWSTLITSCSAGSETLSFDSCSTPLDPAIRIQGSESLSWTGAGCCTANPLSASSATPCSFTRRTVDATGKSDPLKSSIGSNSITLDTETPSGYDQSLSGGFTVACQGTASNPTCEGQRQIMISGAHYTGKTDRSQWDHTVSTDAPIVEQGHGASRQILSGKIRVQHNLAHVTSVTTVQETLTHSAGCCYPTGGSILTTFEGGKLDGKTETMSFGPQCGEVKFTDVTQKASGLTLHHCL
jgi:hypothetical protein